MTAIAQQMGLDIDFYFVFFCCALLFSRIFIMLLFVPFLGSRAVPGRVRLITAFSLSLFLYPLIAPPLAHSFPESYGVLILLFFKEVFFGATIGLVTVMVFHAIEAGGRIIDAQRGGSNAQLFIPQLGQVTIFGMFMFWLAIAFFLSIGGHRHFLKAFFLSYETVPLLEFPGLAPGFSPFLELIVRMAGDVLIIAVQFATPVLIAILLVDLVLGVANKMAPQINVFELGFAAKGYVGPLMLYVSLLIIVTQMDIVMKAMIKNIYRLSKIFAW
jgi:flagellar biosynthetic protein FliR